MPSALVENRAALRRATLGLQRDLRGKALADIRGEIEKIKERRRHVLVVVRAHCERARKTLAERVRARRLEARATLNAEIAALRAEERARCAARRAKVRAGAGSLETEKKRALRAKREELEIVRRADRRGKALEKRRVSVEERRRESDDEVRGNIDAELVPIFERVRSKIRGVPGRKTRTEAFLEWVEANEAEVWAMREREAEAKLAMLEKEERRAARDLRKCGGECWHGSVKFVRELRAEGHPFKLARYVAGRVEEEIRAGDRRSPKDIAAPMLAAAPF
jgi:hypothetical protein